MFRDSFGRGVKIGPTFTDFFVCKIHIIIWTSHPHVSYIWSPSPSALVGAPKYFWFHQFMACIVMRISRPNYEKSVEKGHLFENSYVKFPPPTQVVGPRGTQMILISSVYGMHRYGNLATTLWKKCCRGAPFWKGNLSWNTGVKSTLRVPPQPGCPRVCPPWAHRSYATDCCCYFVSKKLHFYIKTQKNYCNNHMWTVFFTITRKAMSFFAPKQ